jgi:hypothetical protein
MDPQKDLGIVVVQIHKAPRCWVQKGLQAVTLVESVEYLDKMMRRQRIKTKVARRERE